MKIFLRLCAPLLLMLAFAGQAFAAPQGYAVAPFQVNAPADYEHLQKAIPQMLSSRLYWQGHFQAAKQDGRCILDNVINTVFTDQVGAYVGQWCFIETVDIGFLYCRYVSVFNDGAVATCE